MTDSWLVNQYRERVETLEARCEELRRADECSRKAIAALLRTLEEKQELQRSRRVEAEREACTKLVEAYAEGGWQRDRDGATHSALSEVAGLIRARGSETSSTTEE